MVSKVGDVAPLIFDHQGGTLKPRLSPGEVLELSDPATFDGPRPAESWTFGSVTCTPGGTEPIELSYDGQFVSSMFNGRYCVLDVALWKFHAGAEVRMIHGRDDAQTKFVDQELANECGGTIPEDLKHGRSFVLNADGTLAPRDDPDLLVGLYRNIHKVAKYQNSCKKLKNFVSQVRENAQLRQMLFDHGTVECLKRWMPEASQT